MSDPANRNVRGAALLVMLASVPVAVVPYLLSEDGQPDRLRYSLSFAAPFFAAGLLAWLSDRRGTPTYVMTAGLALVPISVISIIAIPLLVPALMLAVLGARASRPGWSAEKAAGIVVILAFIASMMALLVHDDPAVWATADGHQHSTDDLVTGTESLISLAFLAAAFLIAWFVTDRSGAGEDGVGDPAHSGVDRQD